MVARQSRPKRKAQSQAGRPTLFPGKVRGRTISITLTDQHLAQLDAAMARLGLTRADVLALLVDRFADVVEIPPALLPKVRARGEK